MSRAASRPTFPDCREDELSALAWFQDPQTYPRLLEELEAHPSLYLYELLRRLPGIAPALDASVARLWRSRPPVAACWDGGSAGNASVAVALRHGRAEALGEAYRRLAFYPPERESGSDSLLEALRPNLVTDMPVGTRRDDDVLVAWLKKHRPEDYRYDAARRRFVLRDTGG